MFTQGWCFFLANAYKTNKFKQAFSKKIVKNEVPQMCMQLLFTKLIYFTDFDTRRLWVKLTIWFRLHLFIFQEVDFPSPLCTPGRGVQCFYKVSSVLRDKIVLTLHPHQDPHQGNGKTQNWSEASERKDAEQFIYCDHVSSPHFLHQVRRETELGIL